MRPDPAREIDLDEKPYPEDIEAAVLRLRRSYSTMAPDELRRRVEIRLRQVRRLLAGEGRSSSRRSLLAGAAWLALLRATVQADLSEYEARTLLRRMRDPVLRAALSGRLEALAGPAR